MTQRRYLADANRRHHEVTPVRGPHSWRLSGSCAAAVSYFLAIEIFTAPATDAGVTDSGA